MNNIKATIGEYTMSQKEKLRMCAPLAVYLNTNYPKQHIGCQCSVLQDYHKLSFVHKSYAPMGDNIYFQIFPLGAVDSTSKTDYKLLQKYSTSRQKYIHYPSMTLTPAGTLMTSPIIFDALQPFLNNGIFCDSEAYPKSDLISNQAYLAYGGQPSASSYFNWQVTMGAFNKMTEGFNPQSADLFQNKASGTIGHMGVQHGNFGTRKSVAAQKKYKPYSYVQGIPCPTLGTQYDPKQHKDQYTSKRIYKLSSYLVDNPLEDALNLVQKDNEYSFIEDVSGRKQKPFLFIINFSNGQNVNANLDFGYNRIQISPNQLYLTVSDIQWYDSNGVIHTTVKARQNHARRAQCSHLYDRNTRFPYFYRQDKGLNSERSMGFIVYPAYCGIAIQPGLHFPNNLQSSKQSPVSRAIGSVVQVYQNNKLRCPTMQVWLQLMKNKYKTTQQDSSAGEGGEQSDGNIFLSPTDKVHWGDENDGQPLRLTINNGTANFFYMPLYFVSKCRFRMYFKGIKGGKYTTEGLPDEDDPPYVDEAEASSTSCYQEASTQYKSVTKTDEEGEITQTYEEFAHHLYYGSLIYTTQFGVQVSSVIRNQNDQYCSITTPQTSYITTPVASYHIPPISGEKTDKNYWDKYSMDGYYFDFSIDLSGVGDDASANKDDAVLPFVRTPLQVQAVLIMQVTQYQKGMVDNGNGKFNVQTSKLYQVSEVYETTELPITSSTSTSSNSWVQYIQNISTSWNQQGGSGSITLDKYALMGQQALPQQCIGGLRITMEGGNLNIINTSSSSMEGRTCSIFTGYGTKMSTSDSFTSDTITITLQGPQRKLTDLKLINPPFWDGDLLTTAYTWMQNYCGIDIIYDEQYFDNETSFKNAADNALKYVNENGEKKERTKDDFPRFPTSSNFKRPHIYIKTGQDCFSVLKMLAAECCCRFVLQPDGKAYIMTQTKMAVPQMCDQQSATIGRGVEAGYNAVFNQELVLSYSVQPLLNNLHNYVITAAFKSANIGSHQGESTGSIEAGFKVNKKFKKLNTTPQIPWAKMKAFKHEGFMSQARVQQQFERDMYVVKAYWLSVKVTIPGNQMIWIYDKLNLFGIDYYVTDVSHNIDLVGKKWTTELTLSNILKDLPKTKSIGV